MADQGKPMVFDEENNKMVTVDEYYNSIDTDLRCYNCTDIKTVNTDVEYFNCKVFVPSIDLSEAVDRQENLAAISGALENIVGEVESFSYEEVR